MNLNLGRACSVEIVLLLLLFLLLLFFFFVVVVIAATVVFYVGIAPAIFASFVCASCFFFFFVFWLSVWNIVLVGSAVQ